MKVKIEVPNGYKAEWVDGVLTLVQETKKDLRSVTERIKTFEDACREIGYNNPLCVQFYEMYDNFLYEGGDGISDIVAYLKLRIITAALNGNWKPQYTKDECRYYPWYSIYTKDNWGTWREFPEDTKREFGALSEDGDLGVLCNYWDNSLLHMSSTFGFHLCYKSKELAIYSGKQFASIWMDFCYRPNTECKPYNGE